MNKNKKDLYSKKKVNIKLQFSIEERDQLKKNIILLK